MKNTEILHSRRILFRRFTDQDKEKDLEILKNKDIGYLTDVSIEDQDKFIDYLKASYENKKDFHLWHLVRLGEDKSLGLAKLDLEEDFAKVKLLINDSVKNRGYGTEAMETLIHEIFTEGLASKIKVKAKKENGPWIAVIEKAHLEKYKEDELFSYYQMTNLDYMKYFAIFGQIDI